MDNDSSTILEVEQREGGVIVTLHGRISEVEAERVESALVRQVEEGATRIIVDLADVSFITSSALGAFMTAQALVHKQDGFVRLVRAQPLVRQILETTKLTKISGRYDSVEEALAG